MPHLMNSLRGRIVVIAGLLVLLGLLSLSITSVAVSKKHALELLNHQSRTLLSSHASAIADRIAIRKSSVQSVLPIIKKEAPVSYLQQAKNGMGADSVYIGYADKRVADSDSDTV